MIEKYDPENHRIIEQKTYNAGSFGEITIQEIETAQMPTCTWIHYRTIKSNGEQIAWGENRKAVLADTLLALLKKIPKSQSIKLESTLA